MHACTIVARNYLAQAQVLVDSFRRHHPDGTFDVLLVDESGNGRPTIHGADVLLVDEIGIERHDMDRMALGYAVIEFATAVKPWLLRTLLDRGYEHATYFDPDISIERPMSELPGLARDHSIVLTPHATEPMSRDGRKPTEQDILLAGSYNLGFLSVGNTDDARAMLDWWSERLKTDCIVDIARGFFVDQRWMDFVPSLFDHVIVRDPSWNVAYWNLPTRTIEREADGSLTVAGHPLTFMHYSGYSPDFPHLLSKHQADDPRVLLSQRPILRDLCDGYGSRLVAAGFDDANRDFAVPFSTWDGIDLDDRMHRLVRDELEARLRNEDTGLVLSGGDGLRLGEWLVQPVQKRDAIPNLGPYLADVYRGRLDLHHAYPEVRSGDVRGFVDWAELFGIDECGIPRWIVEATRELLPEQTVLDTAIQLGDDVAAEESVEQADAPVLVRGVEVAGYFTADLGIGEAARGLVAGLEHAGIPVSTHTYTRTPSRLGTNFADRRPAPGEMHDVVITCINADMLPTFLHDVGAEFVAGRHHIGFWFWELDEFPAEMLRSAQHLDEIWVTSRFIAEALRDRVDVPVTFVPLPVATPSAGSDIEPSLPGELLETDDRFTFLFVFDYLSVFERKNPLGVIEAFTQAFGIEGDEARLVIKTINAKHRRADQERLRYELRDRSDVILLDRYLERSELAALMERADAYVSLHRSEGFGLTIAESMAAGVPVIATRYSGNLTFMDDDNSFLVDASRVPVPPNCGPYPTTASWADPDLEQAALHMRTVAEGDPIVATRIEQAKSDIVERLSIEALATVATARLAEIWNPEKDVVESRRGKLRNVRPRLLRR